MLKIKQTCKNLEFLFLNCGYIYTTMNQGLKDTTKDEWPLGIYDPVTFGHTMHALYHARTVVMAIVCVIEDSRVQNQIQTVVLVLPCSMRGHP